MNYANFRKEPPKHAPYIELSQETSSPLLEQLTPREKLPRPSYTFKLRLRAPETDTPIWIKTGEKTYKYTTLDKKVERLQVKSNSPKIRIYPA